MPVEVIVPQNFKKVLQRKERLMRDAVARCVKLLGEDPRHPGLQVHKLKGVTGIWEAYVDGANRVTFEWSSNGKIVLRNNCNHDILKRNP